MGQSNRSRNDRRRRLRLAAFCVTVVATAIVCAGCDPDDYDLGQAPGPRSGGSRISYAPKWYSNRFGHATRLNSPEFLAPADSGLDKAPRIADPDAFILSADPLLAKTPEAVPLVNMDEGDTVSGNFKYYKEAYREPLLPLAKGDKDPGPIGADGLSMRDRNASALKPDESDVAGPSGYLGELQHQRKLLKKYNLKHDLKLDPYAPHDYSKDVQPGYTRDTGDSDETSESIIRSDDATPTPAPSRDHDRL